MNQFCHHAEFIVYSHKSSQRFGSLGTYPKRAPPPAGNGKRDTTILRFLAQRLGRKTPHLSFSVYTSKSKFASLADQFEAFLFTSRYEGFGLHSLGARAC